MNSTNNKLIIDNSELKIKKIEIFDMNGKITQNFELTSIYHQLDLSRLKKGVYLLKFLTERGQLTEKVIIQ